MARPTGATSRHSKRVPYRGVQARPSIPYPELWRGELWRPFAESRSASSSGGCFKSARNGPARDCGTDTVHLNMKLWPTSQSRAFQACVPGRWRLLLGSRSSAIRIHPPLCIRKQAVRRFGSENCPPSAAGKWARPEQLPPTGDWRTWLLLAGRGFGKTRSGAEAVRAAVKAGHRRPCGSDCSRRARCHGRRRKRAPFHRD
jgi:hypothetical protein